MSRARWSAYATAGAATTLAALPAAEGHIHYSGPIDEVFRLTKVGRFPLESGANLVFIRDATFFYNSNFFGLSGAAVSSGFQASQPEFGYVRRLHAGQNVSVGHFVRQGKYIRDYIGWGYSEGPWVEPGTGYIAFQFNNGNGTQYGWARIKTRGNYSNIFSVMDYAWGDPGDSIETGQRTDDQSDNLPAEGSLGLLALGGGGLAAWRRRRRQQVR
jgi:MYXO-CTERM domain-containing protein